MDEEVKIEEKIPEGAEEKENVVKDEVYRLIEMCDEMENSIKNVEKVKKEQQYLIDILSKVKDDKLKPLINELTAQLKNLNNQSETLKERTDTLRFICENCEKDEGVRALINNLLYALGVFRGR